MGYPESFEDPTHSKKLTGSDPTPADLTTLVVGGRSSPSTTQLQWVGFGFLPLKLEKPKPIERYTDSGENFQISVKIF